MSEFVGFPKIACLDRSVIPLTNGGVAICSEADFPQLSKYSWFHVRDGNQVYAARDSLHGRIARMHTDVFGGNGPDHVNGDGLDNRRENLRAATAAQNQMNRGKFAAAHSRYKGVTWHKRDRRWVARIKLGANRMILGNFISELEAAEAYDRAAITHFGEFARINFT